MFLIYSIDVPQDRRPWLAHLLFPVMVMFCFVLVNSHRTLDAQDIGLLLIDNFSMFAGFIPFLVFSYFIASLIIFWFFGNAVCSKVGNILYMVLLAGFAALAEGVNALHGEVLVWVPGCILNAIVGMYLMYWPTNSVDCAFLLNPWRRFTVSGFWVVAAWIILDLISVAAWIILDLISVAALGWSASLIAHLVFFLVGLIVAAILLKLRRATAYDDDWTLLQVITRQEREDTAWKDSWSVRKSQKDEDEAESWKTQQDGVKAKPPKPIDQDGIVPLLCQCGHIIRVPMKYEGRKIRCPQCSHVLTVPKSE